MARQRIVLVAAALAVVATAVPADGKQSAPVNDDFAAATAVTDLPFGETVDNSAADIETGEPITPSCGESNATVWYAYAPSADLNVVAETSGTFRSIVAVYEGSMLSDLEEVGCGGGSTASRTEFRALSGHTYFMQVGSAGRRRGLVDVRFSPSSWQEKTLRELDVPIVSNGHDVPIVSFHGRPRASDRRFYDVTLQVSEQANKTHGVLTFGLVDREVKAGLLNLPPKTRRATLTIGYRYDSSQYQCAADSGEGSECMVQTPISDPHWLTGGDGQRAELFIRLVAQDGDTTVAERTVSIPFAGQLAGLP